MRRLKHQHRKNHKIMATGTEQIAVLIQEVTDADTTIDVATAFINGVPKMIQDGIDKALADGATSAQLQPLTDLATNFQAIKAKALADAIAANQPPPPPGP
jgi:hypothetical protein